MRKNKFLGKSIVIVIIAIIAIVVASIILRYNVEGEENIPFEVSKIMVISNAYGEQEEQSQEKWCLNIVQNNDIYIDIVKNKNYNQDEIIEKVIIENFEVNKSPQKGNIELYNAASLDNGVYANEQQYKIIDKLEYIGDQEKSDIKNLQISNQGGLILLRVVNENLGTYISNDDEQIRHDGTLLTKISLESSEVKFTISFDLSIELKSEKKYKTKVTLEMPSGNLNEEGTTNYQISGKNQLIFKRY